MVNIQKKHNFSSERLQTNLDNFLTSLSDVLMDITAIEVNTMVVDHISASKFIPWEAYRDIYLISENYFYTGNIHNSLHEHYKSLRQKLELEYCILLLTDDHENEQLKEYAQFLNDPTKEITEKNTILPNPRYENDSIESFNKMEICWQNGRFLRSLRKLYELKLALDNQNAAIRKNESGELEFFDWETTTDVIYAQSVIQLDGDIINRYDRRLLQHKHKNVILEIHKQGVVASEKQWHGLLQVMLTLVESFVLKRRDLSRN